MMMDASADCVVVGQSPLWQRSLSDTELLLGDEGTIAVDVGLDQIVKKTTTLADKSLKGACCGIIFVI